MTHGELCIAAAKWLRAKKHPIVLTDVRCSVTNEQPDAIGWRNNGVATLVECKASIEDFERDAKKWHRREPAYGMGVYRWYFAPLGVALQIARPMVCDERWGVLAHVARGVRVLREASAFDEHNAQVTSALLVNALRRATEGWGRRMFFEDGDPHPTASKIIRDLRAEVTRLRSTHPKDGPR